MKKASLALKNCDYYCGDLSEERNIKIILNKIKKDQNYIDLLICNLGNSNFKKNNFDIEHAIKNNLLSTTTLIENSKKILRKNKSKIICISSICGIEQIIGAPIGYSVAKSALNFYCDKGDLVILISSSGQSKNIINAGKWCINKKIKLVTFTGRKKIIN